MLNPLQASCPACGGPVRFQVGSSLVTVCPYCRSVIARGDKRLEDLGKVADLVQTDSVLEVGRKGRYDGVPFTLTGRTQLGHEAGGVWDEWYAAFADGRWGWLAEAQGRFYLTFQRPAKEARQVRGYDELALDKPAGVGNLVVAEKGMAKALSAEGEIPFRLEPDATYPYADLSGPNGEFGTLDYSEEEPLLFLGRQVTLDALGFPADLKPRRQEARQVEGLQLSCPQCGGPLALRAPDKTERVACPNCGSLLDASQGRLSLLKALDLAPVHPVLPLGTVGKLNDAEYTVIGYLKRSVRFEGVDYFWEEYLLYHPRLGFRWLVRSDDHWSFVESLQPGAVSASDSKAVYRNQPFKLFQKALARVERVHGEFYWRVEAGEQVQTEDYIRPPQMLSREFTVYSGGVKGGEVNWSLGTYLPRTEVEKAFGLKQPLPAPSVIAPNQPFPYKNIYRTWGYLLLAAFALGIVLFLTTWPKKVFEQRFDLPPLAAGEPARVYFSEPFELRGRRNLRITARSNVDNSWLFLDGDLINEETYEVQPFEVPVEYYHGVEGGESWSEGGKESAAYLSAVPAGKYTLRLEVSWERQQQPATVEVRIDQGTPRLLHLLLALGALSVVPLLVFLYHWSFEARRWQDSEFSPYKKKSSGGDDD